MAPVSAHSVWLVPDRAGATFAQLRKLIGTLAQRSDGEAFDPHVTLIGSLASDPAALVACTRSLAARLTAYEIVLGQVVARPLEANRYRRLFVEVEPTEPVLAANTAARAAFASGDGGAYAPHLSLAYVDGPPAAFEALKAEAVLAGVGGVRFKVGALELWRTTGPVADWRRLGSFTVPATGPGDA